MQILNPRPMNSWESKTKGTATGALSGIFKSTSFLKSANTQTLAGGRDSWRWQNIPNTATNPPVSDPWEAKSARARTVWWRPLPQGHHPYCHPFQGEGAFDGSSLVYSSISTPTSTPCRKEGMKPHHAHTALRWLCICALAVSHWISAWSLLQ